MNNFVKELKSNAIFHMSLSSKELFHSNFLAWLAEDDNTLGVFNQVLRECFGVADWSFEPETMKVGREYKNFDFCICDRVQAKKGESAGAVRLILENKFKSIPYKEQLKKYEDKVEELNKKASKHHPTPTTTKHILLTLADNFLEKEDFDNEDCKWKIVSYQTYIDVLHKASQTLNDCFYRTLIQQYCDFVSQISSHVNESLEKIKGSDMWASLNNPDFTAIRCHDLWQKLMMHKWVLELIKLLKENFPNKEIVLHRSANEWDISEQNRIRVGVEYFHSQALMEVETLLPTGAKILIQQQGNNPLSIGFIIQDDSELRMKKSKRKADAEWNQKVKEKADELRLCSIMAINEKENYHSFQSKNDNGYYYRKGTPDLTIDETLHEMVSLLKQTIELTQNNH